MDLNDGSQLYRPLNPPGRSGPDPESPRPAVPDQPGPGGGDERSGSDGPAWARSQAGGWSGDRYGGGSGDGGGHDPYTGDVAARHRPEERHGWWSRLVTALVGGLLGGGLVLYAVTAGPLAAAPGRAPEAGSGGTGTGTGVQTPVTEPAPSGGPRAPVVDFSQVYAQVAPSVVRVVRTARGVSPWLGIVQEESSGSGVVIDDQGHVVTNYHVVENASRLWIVLDDGTQVEARLVAQDPSHDLALLQADLPAGQVRPARLGDSDALAVGEPVMAVGYPFGLPKTATTGVISGLHRNNLQAPNGRIIREVIQTDAPINPGNSGGALVNARGEVVGINTAILSNVESRPGSIGIGFAVPINILKRELDLFLAGGTVQHPWLGIGGVAVDPASYRERGLAVDHGIQVAEVVPGGPADRAGLRAAEPRRLGGTVIPYGGDVILAVDGQAVRDVPDLVAYLDRKRVGDRVTLRINRDGQELQVLVVLGAFPDELGSD
ncbi:trypsin-like serine protease [Thermaerobacter sp. PB12/4term]|uniref:S1C family serine protease n=1 Tax=Thermaerobacter sp. PB12/4term TaxID=2293838 RepID=UPI000E32CFE4|nr:trypsin-like peptidase domain-containing protein [Thermaerobacter sp. PB12/4term]QIA27363.1 trypsin-like serine protease [Thermaerobacter sp. PB12/4term]